MDFSSNAIDGIGVRQLAYIAAANKRLVDITLSHVSDDVDYDEDEEDEKDLDFDEQYIELQEQLNINVFLFGRMNIHRFEEQVATQIDEAFYGGGFYDERRARLEETRPVSFMHDFKCWDYCT